MSSERAQYDGAELDEIVAENVTLHIEKLDAHTFMIRAWRDGVDIHLDGYDLYESGGVSGLPVIQRGPIAWCAEWLGRDGRAHQCYRRAHAEGTRHRCSCGATKTAVS